MGPKLKPQEAVVLLIDVGQAVSQQDYDGQSFLSKSKKCASRIIQRKIFSINNDQFSLVLIGSTKTENELEYPNINVINKWMVSPNWNLLRDIENLNFSNVDDADWLDGLIVAINLLKTESSCKKFTTLKIVMLSNLATQLRSKDQVDVVIEALKELKINLVIIGPQSDDEDNKEAQKSSTQRKGEAILGRIVDESGGVMCGFDEAMAQLEHFQKFTGRAAAWNCDLQIGNDVFIPISGFKKFAGKNMFTWKKRSIDGSAVTQETVFFLGDQEVDKADVINSYLFGQTVVPVSGDDKSSMALATEKCFQLIGFTKKKNVPRHILSGDSAHYITPRSDVNPAKKGVTALVRALLELDMVGIVRKVYCKNSGPKIGALIPTCEQDSYFFYYVQLPFAEDERVVRMPSMAKVQPSQAQLDAVDKLIDDMDLSQFDEDEDPYSQLVNPAVEHMNTSIVFKAMDHEAQLTREVSEAVTNLLRPKLEVLVNASAALDNIKRVFPLEELEQKRYRKGAAEVFERNANDMEIEDVKPENLGDTMADFVQSKVTEVGTVDPEGNFLKLLQLGEPFVRVCEQMQTAIRKLTLISSSGVNTKKSLSAIALLRKHSISQDPQAYNMFIASLKDDLVQRLYTDVWSMIVQDRLGLITTDESQLSTVSADEADVFYLIKLCETENEVNYEMEAEDLLDMI